MNSADVQDAVANEVNDRLSKATQELANKYAQGDSIFTELNKEYLTSIVCFARKWRRRRFH